MDFSYHGGHCCGRNHVYDMTNVTRAQQITDFLQRQGLLRDTPDSRRNKMTEIVLSAGQNARGDLRQAVLDAGFVLVAVWDNCSGTRCYMYLHANDWQAYPNGVAERVVQPAPAPRPPREEPRVVHSTFHNVLIAGRSDAGWSTRELAVAAAPRAASIDRKDVYASGHVRWVTGV